MKTRIGVIGHVVPVPSALEVGSNEARIRSLLRLYNYTRVLTPEGRLVDHVAYLKGQRDLPRMEPFTVWEMQLCAGLLLSSHLERHGFETRLVNYIDTDNEATALGELRGFDPHIVVLSTTFVLSGRHLIDAGHLVKRYLPEAFVVAGGHHVFTTLMYFNEMETREYLLRSGIDAFVNDVQGELSLLALARAWPDRLATVPNLVWRRPDGSVEINGRMVEDNDVNATPIRFGEGVSGSVVHIRTARSCSFKCAFCSYPTIAGDLALMDIENVITTLRGAKAAGVRALFFVDDTFNVPRPRFVRLIERIIEAGVDMPWYSFLRCQFVDSRLVELMRRSGCQGVFLGVESGSDTVLKNMNKGSAVKYYKPAIGWLRDSGITTVGAFVVGFPGETAETIAETQDFIETSGLDFYFLQPFYYLHHTPVHKIADRFQLKGKGLEWSHATMNSSEACARLDEMFLGIRESVFVNPDYTLWEIAYLQSKGFDMPAIIDYRRRINALTAVQVRKYGGPARVTSRGAPAQSMKGTR